MIACNLDALSAAERSERAALAVQALHLGIGGPPGVKAFLRENGVLGCASAASALSCC